MMIEEDKEKRPSSALLCKTIKSQYIQTFLKTSSLSSVTRCLYSLPQTTKILTKYLQNNNKPRPITEGYINAIKELENNVNNKFNQFKEILAIQNPKLNTDDEIDPVFIITYLIEKMHKELNVVRPKQNTINEPQYLINTTFNGQDEDRSNKNEMLERFFKHFSNNFNSPISNMFFGMLKDKKVCKTCGVFNYNYTCFCLMTFDLNELCGMNNNNGVDLINLFQAMHDKKKEYTINDKIYCDKCLSYQNHIKIKQIYSMPYKLIISLERGVNCVNKTKVNFPFDLNIGNYAEYACSPRTYQLVGCVNRADINNKVHYVSFTRIINSDNWICSDDDKINQVNKNMALSYGIPVLLFYNYVGK
jgi:ubiquitin C-terminal hydrolase